MVMIMHERIIQFYTEFDSSFVHHTVLSEVLFLSFKSRNRHKGSVYNGKITLTGERNFHP